MRWPPVNRAPSRRDLAVFGAGLWLLAALLAVLSWLRGASPLGVVLAAGIPGTLALAFAVAPPARKPLFVGVSTLFYPVGLVVTGALLALLYFLLVTPAGLLRRLTGKDPLRLRRPAPGTSLWTQAANPPDPERYFRQF
ncbi:MAG: hypothetical protein GYA21_11205 [Myxococcales bacterium]|nr:hypothetical protein [Myxococcales bacterium]